MVRAVTRRDVLRAGTACAALVLTRSGVAAGQLVPPAPATAGSTYVAFTSDPQYPRACPDNVPCDSGSENGGLGSKSQARIQGQYTGISRLAFGGTRVTHMVVNGDVTEYGHNDGSDKQLDQMKSIFNQFSGSGMEIWVGLGNHDYANNVGNCAADGCVRNMVQYMHGYLQSKPGILEYDARNYTKYQFPTVHHHWVGSMAYTFKLGPVFAIQLHRYPSYAFTASGYDAGAAQTDDIEVTSSMAWLLAQIITARLKKMPVVVNMHDFQDKFPAADRDQLVSFCQRQGVSAIFAGHIHDQVGLMTSPETTVPYFECGSSIDEYFVLVCFDMAARKLWYLPCTTNEAATVTPKASAWASVPLIS